MTEEELLDSLTDLLYKTTSPEDYRQTIAPILSGWHTSYKSQAHKLAEQVAYWKLSFHKQCEATRDS